MDKQKKKVFYIAAGILVGFGMLLGSFSRQSTESAATNQGLTADQAYWYNQVNHRIVESNNSGVTYNGQ